MAETEIAPDDADEDSIEGRAKLRRAQSKAGIVHYINSPPQNPFKAQAVYQVLKRTHILTYFQSISAAKIEKPEIATADLLPGDIYIHYKLIDRRFTGDYTRSAVDLAQGFEPRMAE